MENARKTTSTIKILLSPKFLLLFAAYVFACMAYSCISSIFVVYGTTTLGLESLAVGAVLSLTSMFGLIMRPFSSVIGDKFNRKKLLLIAYAGLAVSCIVLALAQNLGWLYVAQITRGIAWNLQGCAGYLMVSEIVDKNDIGIAISTYSLAMVIASSVSAVFITGIANAAGYKVAFLCTAVFSCISVLCVCLIRYNAPKVDGGFVAAVKSIRPDNIISFKCLPIVPITFGFQFLTTLMGATWVLKFANSELNIANAGIFALIANAIMYVTKPFFGRIMDRKGIRWCILVSCLGLIAAFLIISQANGLPLLSLGAAVYGIFCGGNAMAGRTMAMKMMPKEKHSVATMTVSYGNDLGISAANVAIPAMVTMVGSYKNTYLCFAAFTVVLLIYALVYGKVYLKHHAENAMNW